jgi:hypothetical protein
VWLQGRAFLLKAVLPTVAKVSSEDLCTEVDPHKLAAAAAANQQFGDGGERDVMANIDLLVGYCSHLMENLLARRFEVPPTIRLVFAALRRQAYAAGLTAPLLKYGPVVAAECAL